MSVIMSDMSEVKDKFTARELSRHTGEVLAAADEFGSVSIHSRNGKVYEIRAAEKGSDQLPDRQELEARFADFDEKLATLNYESPSVIEFEALDSIIAGDE